MDDEAPLLEHKEKVSMSKRLSSCWRICIAHLRKLINTVRGCVSPASSRAWELLTKEPTKTIHAFKMALALSLAFLLVLLKAPYSLFGSHAIWAIMTVVVVFEVTIGATLSKGLNRGAGTLLAALLAVVIGELAGLGEGGMIHPVMVGISAFVIGGVVTFGKLWPTMKMYEYGFRTFLITFSYIIVAEYRQSDPVSTAVNRFFIILLGAVIGVGVNIFVLPLWAGEELHELVCKNFDSLADSLQVCVNEYLQGVVLERVPSKMLVGQAADDPVYKGYRSTLISASQEESLATFASWEPPHGRFRTFKFPWQNYVKVGAVLRHCAYSVVALHACLRSAIQAPSDVRALLKDELNELSEECAKVLRKLGQQVYHMQMDDYSTLMDGVRKAIERLQQSLYLNSYLLVRPETGILERNLMEELPLSVIPEIKQTGYENYETGGIYQTSSATSMGTVHPQNGRRDRSQKAIRKLHSWPNRPVDDFDFAEDPMFEQKVRVLESASALSLGTFAILLVEVALRLDFLAEAVEDLGELARFEPITREQSNCAEVSGQSNGIIYEEVLVA